MLSGGSDQTAVTKGKVSRCTQLCRSIEYPMFRFPIEEDIRKASLSTVTWPIFLYTRVRAKRHHASMRYQTVLAELLKRHEKQVRNTLGRE